MDNLKQNMELWDQVSTTDPKFTKLVSLGKYKFTDIDSMWNIRRATALWGPFGSTWGLKEAKYNFLGDIDKVVALVLEGTFVFPGGSFYIAADLPYESRGETLKKLQTMCIGKALSRLGFSADVYMGQFDDTAYVKEMEAKYADPPSNPTADGSSAGNVPVVDKPSKSPVKKYPEPDPNATGILGSLAQKYMEQLTAPGDEGKLYTGYVVHLKKLMHAVYDKYGMYPTKRESIDKLLSEIPLEAVVEKNDFLDGLV